MMGTKEEVPAGPSSLVEGAPNLAEVARRRRAGTEGFSEAEQLRLAAAFRRFRPEDSSEVSREDLPDALDYLGFFGASGPVIERLASEVSSFTMYSSKEFTEICEKYCAYEEQLVQSAFEAHKSSSADGGTRIRANKLQSVLRKMGVVIVNSVVTETLKTMGCQGASTLSFDQFLGFIDTYRMNQGMTAADIRDARIAYEGVAETPNVSSLARALTQFFGPHSAEAAKSIAEKMVFADDDHVSFYEFCICLRRVRSAMLGAAWSEFQAADTDGDSLASGAVLVQLLPKLCGITLLRDQAGEFLAEASGRTASTHLPPEQFALDFDGFLRLLDNCRASEGFVRSEAEEIMTVFVRFDYDGSGEIEAMELLDMLRWLGHTTKLETVHHLVKQHDANESGGVDLHGIRRLMRLHREMEIEGAREKFLTRVNKTGHLPSSALDEVLESFGWELGPCVVETVLRELGRPAPYSFDDFFAIVQSCRRGFADERRRHAGFTVAEVDAVAWLCAELDTDERGFMSWVALDKALAWLGIPLQATSAASRKDLFQLIEKGKEQALACGVDPKRLEVPGGDRAVSTMVLLHMLRMKCRETEEKVVQLELRAMEETGFTYSEVAGFREIFNGLVRPGDVGDDPASSRLGLAERADPDGHHHHRSAAAGPQEAVSKIAQLLQVDAVSKQLAQQRQKLLKNIKAVLAGPGACPHLSFLDLLTLLRSLGVKPSPEQRKDLAAKVEELSGAPPGRAGIVADQAESVNFATFLRLMRWLQDSNFAGANDAALEIIQAQQEGHAEGRADESEAWAMAATRSSGMASTRSSAMASTKSSAMAPTKSSAAAQADAAAAKEAKKRRFVSSPVRCVN